MPSAPEPTPETVFILGAGFSRAISPAMPLLNELFEDVWAEYAGRNNVPPDIEKLLKADLEEALSYLIQPKPWLREAEILRHRAIFLEIAHVIASVMARALEPAVIVFAAPQNRPSWLIKLMSYWHRNRSRVLTLNYDTLIEAVASWVLSRGVEDVPRSTRAIYPPFLTDAAVRFGRPMLSSRTKTFQLLKLHGSINWFYSGRDAAYGESIYFVPPLFPNTASQEPREGYELRQAAVADKYPFIIPPVFDKAPLLTHETVQSIWSLGGAALSRANRVVCIGYSLPQTDRTMQHFLRSSLNKSARIEVVNKSEDALAHYQRNLAFAADRITQQFSGSDCIEKFVDTLEP